MKLLWNVLGHIFTMSAKHLVSNSSALKDNTKFHWACYRVYLINSDHAFRQFLSLVGFRTRVLEMYGSTIEKPTRCNNNNLLISKISSTCFRQSFAHLQEHKTEIFTTYGIASCCCGRQGFGEWLHGTMCTVWRKCLVAILRTSAYHNNRTIYRML